MVRTRLFRIWSVNLLLTVLLAACSDVTSTTLTPAGVMPTPLYSTPTALLSPTRTALTHFCTGTPYFQAQADLSDMFGVMPGVKIGQLTSSAGGNMLSYYDIPVFSPVANRLIYNSVDKDSINWNLFSANPDGSDAQLLVSRVVPSSATDPVDVSQDGKYVSYIRTNTAPETGWDLYGFRLDASGKCNEQRITAQHWPASPTKRIKTSPASWDAKAGKYVLAFSIDSKLYLVYHDGSGPNGQPGPQNIVLGDSENDNGFYRLRLNPRFSNLLLYRRNTGGARDEPSSAMWVVDWSAAIPWSFQWYDNSKGPHPLWSPDGQKVGVDDNGGWVEYSLVLPNGKLVPNLEPGLVKSRTIGTFGKGDPYFKPVLFGTYSPDGSRIAIVTRPESDEGGKIWLMEAASGKVRFLGRALSFGAAEMSLPRLGFFHGAAGIAFSTDRGWNQKKAVPPQVYTITGYKTSFP